MPNESYISKLGAIKNNAYFGALKVISDSRDGCKIEAKSNTSRFVFVDGRLNKLKVAGVTVVYTNLIPNATVYNVVVNRAGTELYIIDSGDMKGIKNNTIQTLITGLKVSAVALAKSEKYIYYTISDEHAPGFQKT